MPNIKPISDLRNYTTVINEVTYGNRVYLTRNGHGQCAIIDMKELDELDKQKALYTLMSKLNEAEVSIREEGTISADDLEAEVERLAEDGRLSREMAECIETEDMMRFLRTKSGVRMLQAARNRKLYKEQPFVISVNASEIYQGDLSGEKILVQGIIDVYFEEEDGLVVLDYKTDQVKSRKELVEKYHAQLEYYAHALSQLTGKTVKEKIIYSFTLKEEIIV